MADLIERREYTPKKFYAGEFPVVNETGTAGGAIALHDLVMSSDGILHSPERHRFELHASGRITEILLHSGKIAEDHDVVVVVHWEMSAVKKLDHQIVFLLRKLSFLLCHRPQSPHAFSDPFGDRV